MKSLKIPMTVDEFHLTQWKFGWKDEYWNGHARISPRHNGVFVKVPVAPRAVETVAELRPLADISFDELVELFYAAFVDSVEYCDYKKGEIKKAAEKNIRFFFDGKRGVPQPELSCVAVVSKRKKQFVAACLITKYKYGLKNEILFVRPQLQNKNIGTALVSAVLNDLHLRGEPFLWSEYQICNEQSAAWHEKFGFTEEPDVQVARLRYRYLQHEIWRNNELGNTEIAKELEPTLQKVEANLDLLVKLERLSFDQAHSHWRHDF